MIDNCLDLYMNIEEPYTTVFFCYFPFSRQFAPQARYHLLSLDCDGSLKRARQEGLRTVT